MADPAELLKAWQHAIRDLGGAAASLASGPAGAASDLVRPLQHQAELLQQVLQRQLEFERELVGRAAAPLHAAQDLVDQATGTLRARSGGRSGSRDPPGGREPADVEQPCNLRICTGRTWTWASAGVTDARRSARCRRI